MPDKIQLRRDSRSNWENDDPVLDNGEVGLDVVNKLFKIGDGTTPWVGLGYAFGYFEGFRGITEVVEDDFVEGAGTNELTVDPDDPNIMMVTGVFTKDLIVNFDAGASNVFQDHTVTVIRHDDTNFDLTIAGLGALGADTVVLENRYDTVIVRFSVDAYEVVGLSKQGAPVTPQGRSMSSRNSGAPLDADTTLAASDYSTILQYATTAVRTVSLPAAVVSATSDVQEIQISNLPDSISPLQIRSDGSGSGDITFGTIFENTRSYQGNGATTENSVTLSVDATAAGSNQYLLVAVIYQADADSTKSFSATYNGTSMNVVLAPTSEREQFIPGVALLGLANPAQGANDLVLDFNAEIRSRTVIAVPMAGVSGVENATGSRQSPASSVNLAITSGDVNRVLFAFAGQQNYAAQQAGGITFTPGEELVQGASGTNNVASDHSYAAGRIVNPQAGTNNVLIDFQAVSDGVGYGGVAIVPVASAGTVSFMPNSLPTDLQPGETYVLQIQGSSGYVLVGGDAI